MTTEACRRWRELFGAYLLGHLTTEEHVGLEAHLDGCAECRAELEELRPVAGALASADPAHLGTPPQPPPDLAERVFAQVHDVRRLERRRRMGLRVGAGIAAAVIALSVAVVLRSDGPRVEREEFTFPTLPAGVQAVATLYRREELPGVEVWLEVEGLTPGATYAVWVERATGDRVRCGTFDAVDGKAHVVLPSTVSRSDAAAVGVSTTEGALVMRAPVTQRV
jgi:predicted anti-sigma-YlaC factor YlaD